MTKFKHLFSNLEIGNTVLKNRILTTAHQTNHVVDGIPTDDLIEYHITRAKGGLGLAILEAAAVHKTGMLTGKTIAAFDPNIIPVFKKLSTKMHHYGTKVFAQLFHGGREVISDSYRNPAWAPSAEPSIRFGAMPRPLNLEEIEEIIEGFAISALHMKEAGLDGVEIACSHGYLPAQFWSHVTNKRTDEYGGSFENRMRFIVEVLERIWDKVGEDFTVGIRISADEMTMDGLKLKDSVKIVEYLSEKVRIDFINVTSGDSSTYAGSTHIAPASPMKHAYNASKAFEIRMAAAIPTFVGTRIVDPEEAEDIIKTGKADAVGMTRATIVDPDMPNKAMNNEAHLINACLGCLQACIGHYHKGLEIGCVQNPYAGKEREFLPLLEKETPSQKVLVIGAGPGGLQAAITASQKGHEVILADKEEQIGGMLNVMKKAPMRQEMAEFMLDNYSRQLATVNVEKKLGKLITANEVKEINPDVIICATGSRPYTPHVSNIDDERIIQVDDLFKTPKKDYGKNTVVFDFGGDWAGIEAAIHLAEAGSQVTFYTTKLYFGQEIHQYLRNEYMKKLYKLNLKMISHHDFGGIENDKVIARNLFTHEKIAIENWDYVVLAYGRVPNVEVYEEVKHLAPVVHQIGDCLAPRTIEEATLEGLETVLKLEESLQTVKV